MKANHSNMKREPQSGLSLIVQLKTKNSNTMKGISYLTDEKNHKKAVVIDLKTIEKKYEDVHEFIDVLVAESRKGGEAVSWEEAKKILRKKGKL